MAIHVHKIESFGRCPSKDYLWFPNTKTPVNLSPRKGYKLVGNNLFVIVIRLIRSNYKPTIAQLIMRVLRVFDQNSYIIYSYTVVHPVLECVFDYNYFTLNTKVKSDTIIECIITIKLVTDDLQFCFDVNAETDVDTIVNHCKGIV